jgi:hypothetical protein
MVNSTAASCDDAESTADQYRNIYVLLDLLVYALLNDAVRSSDYITSNDRMINELERM